MGELFNMNIQLFGAGTLVNTTTQYINSVTQEAEQFTDTSTLRPTMKEYYDTELLENARSELYFAQFGRKQGLPANRGRVVEWRKWNTLPNAEELTEGVIPNGKKMGMTSVNAELKQYGMYVAISDVLDLHAVDNMILGATEELGASAGMTKDILIRNAIEEEDTNIMYCDTVNGDTTTEVEGYDEMSATNNRLTPDMVNKAVTFLKKNKAPKINGKYVAIIHPSVAYDIRSCNEWIEVHKYAATTEIFNGEIGELHGVRFVETTNAKITSRTLSGGTGMVYTSYFMGKDAYGIIDPVGGSMETIVKNRSEIGGPLEQYSTVGYKFEDCTKLLYPERLVLVESCSAYSTKDEAN